MVKYYRDLWTKRSGILALLTELTKGGTTKNGPIEWNPACTEAFQQMKEIISKETILAYPDFSKKFTIHTALSDLRLGAVITKERKALFLNSRK